MTLDPELEGLEQLPLGLRAAFEAPIAPAVDARERLLAAVSPIGRFDRFVPAVAEMADVSESVAKGWLDEVWDGGVWERAVPGAMAWWVEGGPRVKDALRGFVRVGAGVTFGHHEHLGEELVLVLQGGARVSDGTRLRAGDRMSTPGGDAHSFGAVAGGTDLLIFTVIHGGLDFGSFKALPRP